MFRLTIAVHPISDVIFLQKGMLLNIDLVFLHLQIYFFLTQ